MFEAPEPIAADAGVRLPPDSLGYRFKRKFLGPPLHSDETEDQRLGKPTALAVFASDNLSSSAYATEEILHVLVPLIGLEARDGKISGHHNFLYPELFELDELEEVPAELGEPDRPAEAPRSELNAQQPLHEPEVAVVGAVDGPEQHLLAIAQEQHDCSGSLVGLVHHPV